MSGIVDTGNKKVKVVLGDKEYTLGQLTTGGMRLVGDHLRNERSKNVQNMLALLPDNVDKTEATMQIFKEFLKPITDDEITKYMSTQDGALYTLWVCINADHPDFSYEDFLNMPLNELAKAFDVDSFVKAEVGKKKRRKQIEVDNLAG